MTTRDYLVFLPSLEGRPVSYSRLADAAESLSDDATWCAVIEPLGPPAGRDPSAQARRRAEDASLLLGLPSGEFGAGRSLVVPWETISGEGLRDEEIRIIVVASMPRLVYVQVSAVRELVSVATPPFRALNSELLRGVVQRSTGWREASEEIASALDRERALAIETDLETITVRADDAMQGASEAEIESFLGEALSYRRRARALEREARAYDDNPLATRVHRALQELDALASLISSRLLVRLFDSSEQRRLAEADEEKSVRGRERQLARLGAGLILPSLWLSYWGDIGVPQLGGWSGNTLIVGGAVAFAGLGVAAAGLLFRKNERR